MNLLLEIDGSRTRAADLDELLSIIRRDDDLRSIRTDTRVAVPSDGAMGPVTDALLLAIGSGGAGVALLQTIGEWMRNRRSQVRVKLTSQVRTVEIDVDSIDAPEKALELLRSL